MGSLNRSGLSPSVLVASGVQFCSETGADVGARLFGERLAIAEAALEHAWKLDPTDEWIANGMLIVEKGQGKGRDRMELWFRRAMALNTNKNGPSPFARPFR